MFLNVRKETIYAHRLTRRKKRDLLWEKREISEGKYRVYNSEMLRKSTMYENNKDYMFYASLTQLSMLQYFFFSFI